MMPKKKPNPFKGAKLETVIDVLRIRGFEVRCLSGSRRRWSKNNKFNTVTVQLIRVEDGKFMNLAAPTYGNAVRLAAAFVVDGAADDYINYYSTKK